MGNLNTTRAEAQAAWQWLRQRWEGTKTIPVGPRRPGRRCKHRWWLRDAKWNVLPATVAPWSVSWRSGLDESILLGRHFV